MNTRAQIQKILFRHLSPKDYQVFLFGSRATGEARKWSDWDIGIKGKDRLPLLTMFQIKDDLENSNIPYRVDVVDLNRTSDKFKKIALKTSQKWLIN